MRTRTSKAGLAVLGATLALSIGTGSGIAAADPGFTPDKGDLVGVGSDTTQDVMNALAAGYDSKTPTPVNRLASFDATGSATITPATGCAAIARPDGSSAGIAALANDTSGCLDFARSSRAARSTDPANLAFVPFAADAVSYVKSAGSHVPAALSKDDLRAIYTCAKTTFTQVGGTSTATIIPILPNINSGTRAFFLTAISVDGVTPVTPGSCVIDGTRAQGGAIIQENDARELSLALAPGQSKINALIPYSVAKYIFQGKPKTVSPERNNSVMGNVKAPAGQSADPITGSRTATSNTEKLNPNFNASFSRRVYNVLKTVNGAIPAKYAPVFKRTGYICSPAGDRIVAAQGFGVLPQTACGY